MSLCVISATKLLRPGPHDGLCSQLTEALLHLLPVDSLQIPTIFVGRKQGEILRRAAIAGNSWVELHCGRVQVIEDRHERQSPPIVWPPEDVCASSPCENGGTCVSGADPTTLHSSGTVWVYSEYTCDCPSGFTGPQCDRAGQLACEDDPTVRALHFPLSHSFSHKNMKSPCAEQWKNWVTGLGCAEYKKSKQWCHTDQGKLGRNDNRTLGAIDPINLLIYAYQACPASCGTC